MESIIHQIYTLRKQHSDNDKSIFNLRAENDKILQQLQILKTQLRNEPLEIEITDDKQQDIINSIRCFICSKIADYQCYTCKQDSKPAGFCESHYNHAHMKERNDHIAIWIFLKNKIKYIEKPSKPTPEQELEQLLKLSSDLDKQIAEKRLEVNG